MQTTSSSVLRDAETLWDYHDLQTPLPVKADFILATGSHDLRVAAKAAELKLLDIAPLLVVSGGAGKVTKDHWTVTEAEAFAQVALEAGVASDEIIIEREARNTGDNVTMTRAMLEARDLKPASAVLVTKPYMKRRAFAAAAKQWPEISWTVAAPELTFQEYPSDDVPLHRMINLMVGDLQRIKLYAEQGFQIQQDIPPDVWAAYDRLVAAGFDQFVIS